MILRLVVAQVGQPRLAGHELGRSMPVSGSRFTCDRVLLEARRRMGFLRIVPLAFVMIAGPQIVSAIMLATSRKPRANSLAYDSGAVLSTVVGTSVVYFVAGFLGAKAKSATGGSGNVPMDLLFIVLLLLLAYRAWAKRNETEPPKWMSKLQEASPRFAFQLGLVLFIAMPTDVLTMVTVGTWLSAHHHPLYEAVPFFLMTAVLIAVPLIVLLLMGRRAQGALPKLRDWMKANSWIISEVVIVFFVLMEIGDLLKS